MRRMMPCIYRTVGILAAMMLVVMMTGCIKIEKDTTKEIIKSGVLRVAVSDEAGGLIEKTDGGYTGAEADLVHAAAAKLGVTVQYESVESRASALSLLEQGKADLAIGSISEHHVGGNFAASEVYAEQAIYVVTKRGVFANSVKAYQDSTVGIADALYRNRLDAFSTFSMSQLKPMDDSASIIGELNAEMIAAYYCCQKEAIELLEKTDLLQVQNVVDAEPDPLVMVTIPENQELLNTMNEVIGNGTF